MQADSVIKRRDIPTFTFRVFTIESGRHIFFYTRLFDHINDKIESIGTILVKAVKTKQRNVNLP